MKTYTAIIIGGGPSGLFCSFLLAKEGAKVLLLEKMQNCGRKLLISGSGQCNLTHTGTVSDFLTHYGDNGKFIKPALMNFSNVALLQFFEERKVHFCEDGNGKYFPKSGKARDILDTLLCEAGKAGVVIHTNEPVLNICCGSSGFMITSSKESYQSSHVILATGGYTYPVTGSTGDGYQLAKNLGHTIEETGPALTPIYIHHFPLSDLAGISFPTVPLSLYRNNKKIREIQGDLLITHQGFSGPGILDLSRHIRNGDELRISFIQYQNINSARDELINLFSTGGSKKVKKILTDLHLPDRFVKKILDIALISTETTCAQFSKKLRTRVISMLLEYQFSSFTLGGPDEAMVTRGGISLEEIKKDTMESVHIPGLYCIGEVLDIDGDCGGYNLQVAFSTGALAADSILKKMRKKERVQD
jgi:predicted Rossmann fold flavoprotein